MAGDKNNEDDRIDSDPIGGLAIPAMIAAGGIAAAPAVVEGLVALGSRVGAALSASEAVPTDNIQAPFPRPEGVPEDWVSQPSRGEGGIKYVDPQNSGSYIRIMPGNVESAYPNSQAPYVRWQVNGQSLDINGNPVAANASDAHIPLTNFKFNPKIFK